MRCCEPWAHVDIEGLHSHILGRGLKGVGGRRRRRRGGSRLLTLYSGLQTAPVPETWPRYRVSQGLLMCPLVLGNTELMFPGPSSRRKYCEPLRWCQLAVTCEEWRERCEIRCPSNVTPGDCQYLRCIRWRRGTAFVWKPLPFWITQLSLCMNNWMHSFYFFFSPLSFRQWAV